MYYSPHKFELAVRRYERNGMFSLKLAQLHALVELAVVDHHHGLAGARRVAVRVAGDAAAWRQHYTTIPALHNASII